MTEYISFPCLKVKQPIGTFFIGVIEAQDLIKITYADIRRPEGRDIERYIGTQRDLSEDRVKEIKQYVTTIDACFPTSVILSIESENIIYNEQSRTLRVINSDRVAKIIDGQHRIAGLKDYNNKGFEINVTIFVDMDIEDQAMVFATINLKQTKVTKSLAYDLYEYAKSRSPQKTCHNIAKLLNSKESSPFHRRIKILGKATGVGSELITQSTFVDRLMRLVSKDPMDDKDKIKRKKEIEVYDSEKLKTFVFRERFRNERDAEIAKIIWNYFVAVEMRWKNSWNNFDKGMILARTTGFAAFMRLLPSLFIILNAANSIPKPEEFLKYLRKSKLRDEDFNSDKFKPGSSGEGELLKILSKDILD